MPGWLFLQSSPPSGSVPGVSDAAAVVIGAVLSLLVLYAIVSAHLRKRPGANGRPPN
jgi:hypothetical protein